MSAKNIRLNLVIGKSVKRTDSFRFRRNSIAHSFDSKPFLNLANGKFCNIQQQRQQRLREKVDVVVEAHIMPPLFIDLTRVNSCDTRACVSRYAHTHTHTSINVQGVGRACTCARVYTGWYIHIGRRYRLFYSCETYPPSPRDPPRRAERPTRGVATPRIERDIDVTSQLSLVPLRHPSLSPRSVVSGNPHFQCRETTPRAVKSWH